MQARTDIRKAQVIQQGIAIDATEGAAHAWVFMTAYDIPRQTIMRVLSDPDRRRILDMPAEQYAAELWS